MGATAAFPCLAGHVTLLWRNWDVTSPLAKSLSARPCSSWTSAEGQCSFCDLSRLPGTTAVTVQSATLLALRTSRRLCGRPALAAEGTPSPDTHCLLRLQPLVLSRSRVTAGAGPPTRGWRSTGSAFQRRATLRCRERHTWQTDPSL